MKHSPKQNAEILDLHARTVQLHGTHDEQIAQLRQIFANRPGKGRESRENGWSKPVFNRHSVDCPGNNR